MEHFERLKQTVAAGQLAIVNIVAIPRSMSTVLGVLLSQGADNVIFVNEPISRTNRDLDIAAESILTYADTLLPKHERVIIVTKNMATYLSDETYAALTDISQATLWSVRDPLLQMGSLLTRMVNDMQSGLDSDTIHQNQLDPYLPSVTAQLQQSDISTDFSRTGWAAINRLFMLPGTPSPTFVVDGSELVRGNRDYIQRLCDAARMPFNETMVSGWTGGTHTNLDATSSRAVTATSAWTKEAATHSRLHTNSRPPLDLATLPLPLREHIERIAIPTYARMVGGTPHQ